LVTPIEGRLVVPSLLCVTVCSDTVFEREITSRASLR